MRWRLLILSALTAAFLGAITIIATSSLLRVYGTTRTVMLSALLLIVAIFPSVIVYRRTAKRRKTQAAVTGLLTLILTVVILISILNAFAELVGSAP